MLPKSLADLGRKDILLHVIVLAGLAGLVCIALSTLLSPTKTTPDPADAPDALQDGYRTQVETELAAMLEAMEGVGHVELLVTLAGSEEYRYAREDDRQVSGDQVRSSSTYVTVGSGREALVESVAHPAVTGVVVACAGGASPVVREAVAHAVAVACDLPLNKIFVTCLAS